MARVGRLRATPLATVEALGVIHRYHIRLQDFLSALEGAFDIDDLDTMRDVAFAVDQGTIKTVFDAYHVASALRRGETFHTADHQLLASAYPTIPY